MNPRPLITRAPGTTPKPVLRWPLANAWVSAEERDKVGLLFWTCRVLLQEWAGEIPRRPNLEQQTAEFLERTKDTK